jgi:uncharacterized protein (TIGR02996 family)
MPAAIVRRTPNWQEGTCTTYRGGFEGLWLQFSRDADMEFMCHYNSPTVVRFQAGQTVHIIDSRRMDDCLKYEPTVRADRAEVHVLGRDAVVEVQYLPSLDTMQRVYMRSADDLAFWSAIIADPNNDLPRLLYADYLDERGDSAAGILRGSVPLALQYSISENDMWTCQAQQPADWRFAVSELQAIAGLREFRLLEKPGYSQISIIHLVRCQGNDVYDEDAEWRRLSVSMESGRPVPPFVNYLLIRLAFARYIPSDIRVARHSATFSNA